MESEDTQLKEYFLIVGLGNPGDQYARTVHNIAWVILDFIAGIDEWEFDKFSESLNKKIENVWYVKPQTFMNNSGRTVKYLKDNNNIANENIIVLHDDIDLEQGRIKISFDRGDGGHNGIKSIHEYLGETGIVRIRIGVSPLIEGEIKKPNVLARITSEKQEIYKKTAGQIKEVLSEIIKKGFESAMNKFN